MAKKYYESKTPRWQRWAIWIVAIAMVGGTILTYVVILIANNNTSADPTQIAYNKYLENYYKEQEEEMAKQDEIRAKYVAFDNAFADKINEFEPSEIVELKVTALREGDGAVIKGSDTVLANYTGWASDGKIFDTTRRTAESETSPIEFPLSGVITGWTQGLTGQKVGGVYLLEIPSRLAYGDDASTGRPTGPLKFLVEIKEIR